MTLEAIYFISQIIAALAIVASLVFVGIQIRQNTKATRAASAFEVNRMFGVVNVTAAQNIDESMFRAKVFDPDRTPEEFTEQEKARAATMALGLSQLWLAQFRMYREGSLSKEDWELHGLWAARFYQLPIIVSIADHPWLTWVESQPFADEIARLAGLEGSDYDFRSRFSAQGLDEAGIENTDKEATE